MTKTVISHDERLRTVGTNTRGCVDRIVATYGRASEHDRESGARWYAEGELFIDSLAAQADHTREAVAAVVAHLSPRTTWQRNMLGAQSLILTGEAPGCLGANVERARRALASDQPLGTLNGPKVRRFAANLLGCRESVTVDVWAARVAFSLRDDAELILSRVGIYEAVEHTYRVAARRLGVDPVTTQATTWIVARNGRAV
jgi:hypothetical protein